jgi:hypothetical protein
MTLQHPIIQVVIEFLFIYWMLEGPCTNHMDVNPPGSADSSIFRHEIMRLLYRGADKSLARPTSRCILFDV